MAVDQLPGPLKNGLMTRRKASHPTNTMPPGSGFGNETQSTYASTYRGEEVHHHVLDYEYDEKGNIVAQHIDYGSIQLRFSAQYDSGDNLISMEADYDQNGVADRITHFILAESVTVWWTLFPEVSPFTGPETLKFNTYGLCY